MLPARVININYGSGEEAPRIANIEPDCGSDARKNLVITFDAFIIEL